MRAKLAAMPIIPALDVPADIAGQYQTMIARLEEELADPDQCTAAMGTIRSLITGVVLEPGCRPGEVRALLRGALVGLIKATTGRELPLPVGLPSVDAGTGSALDLRPALRDCRMLKLLAAGNRNGLFRVVA